MLKQNVIVELKDMIFICIYVHIFILNLKTYNFIFCWFISRDTVTLAPNFDPKVQSVLCQKSCEEVWKRHGCRNVLHCFLLYCSEFTKTKGNGPGFRGCTVTYFLCLMIYVQCSSKCRYKIKRTHPRKF